jgi:hypothetical protein
MSFTSLWCKSLWILSIDTLLIYRSRCIVVATLKSLINRHPRVTISASRREVSLIDRRESFLLFISSDLRSENAKERNESSIMCNNIFNVWKICLKTVRRCKSIFAFNFLSRFSFDAQMCRERGKDESKRRPNRYKSERNKKYEKIRYNLWFVYSKQAKAGAKKFFHSISIRMGCKILLLV